MVAASRRAGGRRSIVLAAVLGLAAALAHAQDAPDTVSVEGDAVPASLTGASGDPSRGRAIVTSRQLGLCLLCHSGPFPEERFQGDLAPDLTGVGSRLSAGQLRLRIVDSGRINAATIMPAYYKVDGLTRVASAYRGKPALSAQQIEDVVAFLTTFRN